MKERYEGGGDLGAERWHRGLKQYGRGNGDGDGDGDESGGRDADDVRPPIQMRPTGTYVHSRYSYESPLQLPQCHCLRQLPDHIPSVGCDHNFVTMYF